MCVLLGVAFLVLSVFANEVIATSSDRYFKVVTTNVFFRFFYIVHADKGFVVGSSDLSFSCKKWIIFFLFFFWLQHTGSIAAIYTI